MDPSDEPPAPISVLFVCLGNICRSPLAEGIFSALLRDAGLEDRFEVDSAGTGSWHVGERADARSRQVAAEHGVSLESRARQIVPEDLSRFDTVVAMDRDNLDALRRIAEASDGRASLHLLREFDPEGEGDVPDPYYGGDRGFERVYRMIHRSCEGLLAHLGRRADGGSVRPETRKPMS